MKSWLWARRRRIIYTIVALALLRLTEIPPPLSSVRQEEAEGRVLAKSLLQLGPESMALIAKEHVIANELKVTLEESAGLDKDTFIGRFKQYVDRLVEIRDKRQAVFVAVADRQWNNALNMNVQRLVFNQLKAQIARTQQWIEYTENIRLRAELGRKDDFPELPKLKKGLEGYLSLPAETPLYDQVKILTEEYHFTEAELYTEK